MNARGSLEPAFLYEYYIPPVPLEYLISHPVETLTQRVRGTIFYGGWWRYK